MRHFKSLISLILVIAMLLCMFVACNKNDTAEETTTPTISDSTPDETTNAPSEPEATEPAETEPVTTDAPTEAPTTEAPTEAPTTEEPTEEPTTDEPATDDPATEDPTTDEPATEEPTTDEPVTDPVTESYKVVTELHDGDHVLIGAPAYGKLLSAEKVSATSYYNKGVDYSATDFSGVTDAEIFVVTVNADGSYTFTSLTGKVLALAAEYSSLNDQGENKSWVIEECGEGLFLLKNTARGNYLEWYSSKDNWSTYTKPTTDEYKLSFYVMSPDTEDPAVPHEHEFVNGKCECGEDDPNYVPPHEHEFVNGKCECGEDDPNYVPPTDTETTNSADFDNIELPSSKPTGDSSYTNTYTTPNGWVVENSAIQCGGSTDMNPQYTVIGPDTSSKAVCLNGKVSAPGKITSPTLSGGVSKITVTFTKIFTDTALSVTVKVTDLASGAVYTHVIERTLDKNEKYQVYTDEWTLETPVTGEFTIEIVNNSPTQNTGNKDRMTILDLSWVGATATHTHNYTSTTTATCTEGGVTTYTCTCGDTYTENVEKLDHVDANLDVECDRDGCTSKVAPTPESVLSIFTANKLGSLLSTPYNYYVEGTIVEVLDARNGIFLIGDGTGETFYFRLPKDANDVSHANWEIKLVLGDKVRVYGKINKFTTPEAPNGQYYPAIQGGTVETLEQHPHVFSDPNCTDAGYCVCGQVGPAALGHTDADTNDICDVCEFNLKLDIVTISTKYDDVKNTDKVDTTNGTALFEGEHFNITFTKGSSSFNTNGSNHMRMNKGNDLKIEATSGKNIVGLSFTTTSSSYVDELELFLQALGYEYTVDGTKLTISVDPTTSITLTNSSNKSQRIAAIEIIYEK